MKILKWIRKYIDQVRSRFRKRKREREIFIHIGDSKNNSLSEIESKIEEFATSSGNVTEKDIKELVDKQTEIELQSILESDLVKTKTRKRVFDIVEVEQEIGKLNRKLYDIKVKQKQIEPVRFPQNYSTDKNIEKLESILLKHDYKQNLIISTSAIDKLKSKFGQFDKFLEERILIRVFRKREEERKKEEETKKQQVKELIGRIENLINHGNLQEVQNQIAKATSSITGLRNLDQKKSFREKLETLKSRFRERQIREEAKRQTEELKKQHEEAEHRRLAEEVKKEEERKYNEEYGIIDDNPKKNSILTSYNISGLYHMTDISNLNNIFKFGLLSHTDAHKKCLVQRDISDNEVNDRRNSREPKNNRKIHDYVPLYFNPRNPMLYRRKDWQNSIVILEIDNRFIYQKNSLFTNGNAASNSTIFFNDLTELDKVDLNFILGNGYWTDYQDGKRKKCSEVLAYPIIGRQYILKVHCKNTQIMEKVREIARNSNFEVSCSLTSKLYF